MKTYTINEDILKESIFFSWNKQYAAFDHTPEEKVALIFSNLYKVLDENEDFIALTYDTLLELVPTANTELKENLTLKKSEILRTLVSS